MKVVGFWNKKKKNENEPDIRIYKSTEQGEDLGESIQSLWINKSAAGNEYFSGTLSVDTKPKYPETTEDDGGEDIPF